MIISRFGKFQKAALLWKKKDQESIFKFLNEDCNIACMPSTCFTEFFGDSFQVCVSLESPTVVEDGASRQTLNGSASYKVGVSDVEDNHWQIQKRKRRRWSIESFSS